jgi:hypothetical protein
MTEGFEREVEQLRCLYPDAYLDLQSTQLEFELTEVLCLQSFVDRTNSVHVASVKLNDGYWFLIKPATPGYGGLDYWMSWSFGINPITKRYTKYSRYRCRVELIHKDGQGLVTELAAFTVDPPNVAELIRWSRERVKLRCHLTLVALPIPNQTSRRRVGDWGD